MSKLGQYLKSEREKRGLSLHEIGLSLKINPKILTALEEGQRENLPAKTFLRGFVRSYAQYLRLNVDEALELFNEEYGKTRPEPKPPASNDQEVPPVAQEAQPTPRSKALEENYQSKDGNRLTLAVVGVVLFVSVIFVVKMVDKYQRERARPEDSETLQVKPTPSETPLADSALDPLTSPSPVDAAQIQPSGSPLAVASPTPGFTQQSPPPLSTPMHTPQPTASPPPKPTVVMTPTMTPIASPTPQVKASPSATPAPQTPTPTPTPKMTPTPAPTSTPAPTPKATPTPSATPTPTPAPTEKINEIIFETHNDVSVKYTLNDGRTQTLQLTARKLHTLRAKGPVVLELSDGGAVNLIVNGRDRGVPGQIGQPLKLNVP